MGGAMQLGQAAPQFEAIAEARGAAYQVFKVIDRVGAPPTNFPSAPEQLQMPSSLVTRSRSSYSCLSNMAQEGTQYLHMN